MSKSNKKKAEALGMPHGTARNRLTRMLLFQLIQRTGDDNCYQCGEKIEDVESMSIEHKTPWQNSENPVDLFFDLENIAFSHLSCNIAASNRPSIEHGKVHTYNFHGCRCDSCRDAKSKQYKKTYTKESRRNRYMKEKGSIVYAG